MMKKLILALVLITAVISCGKKQEDKQTDLSPKKNVTITKVVGVGRVEPEGEIVSLASPTGGVVSDILAHEGEIVKKGEPVIRLDDRLEEIKMMQLRSQVATQRAQVENDRISLESAKNKMENRRRFLESTRALAGRGAETQQNLDDTETDFRSLSLAAESAKAVVDISQNRLHELEAQLSYSEEEFSRKTIKAPSDGRILRMNVMKGSSVASLGSFADFAPAGKTIVRAEVDEFYADRLQNGFKAAIMNAGGDSALATGRVSFISPYLRIKSLFSGKSNEQEDRLVREVKISLDNESSLLLNSKVECVIYLNQNMQ